MMLKYIKSMRASWISVIVGVCIIALIQFGIEGTFSDPDGFYHAKVSQLMEQGELESQFPWLQFTTWRAEYADQHYLYHWLLIPFNSIELLPVSIVVFAAIF